MLGLFRVFIAVLAIAAALYAIGYVWTGQLPPYAIEVAATFGILFLVSLLVALIARPVRSKR